MFFSMCVAERHEIMRKVEVAWNQKNKKLLERAMNPLYRQQRMLGVMDSSDDEAEDEETAFALKEIQSWPKVLSTLQISLDPGKYGIKPNLLLKYFFVGCLQRLKNNDLCRS